MSNKQKDAKTQCKTRTTIKKMEKLEQNEKSQTLKLIALSDRCSYNLNIFYISEVFFNVISSKSPVFQGQIGRKSKKYLVPTT